MSLDNTTFVSTAMKAEADRLFPSIKVPSPEPKLRQPEFVGRNPFTEMRRRHEHAQFLREAEGTSATKAKQAVQKLEGRKLQLEQEYAYPVALALTAAEEAALIENSATQLFPSGRAAGNVLPPIPTTPNITSPVARSTSSVSFAISSDELWDAAQWIDQGEPAVTGAEAKTSKSQLIKFKKQKHIGYFGEDVENIYVFDPAPLLKLPTETDRVVVFANIPFTVDKLMIIDDGPLKAIFGSAEVRLPRATGEMRRAEKKLLGNEAHEQLRSLRLVITGKPSTPWAGEGVTLDLQLSSFSYTVKSYALRTSGKKFPNIFRRFGVDLAELAAVSPFPLRLDDDQWDQPTDAESIVAQFCAKSQLRIMSCNFRMMLFGGSTLASAQLVASGTLGATVPEVELTLRLTLPILGFSFRGASRMLSFLDIFSFRELALKLRRDVDAQEYMHIELFWDIRDSPLLGFVRQMYDDEPSIKLCGIVDSRSSVITLRSEELAGERSTTLWRFLKLRKIVAFVECDHGVTRFGVECIVGVPCGQELVEFEGRIFSELTETSLSSVSTPQDVWQQDQTFMRFAGTPIVSLWTTCGSQSFAHMIDMSLQLHLTCDAVLPTRCEISGHLLLCGGEPTAGDCGMSLDATAFFTLDSFPDYAVIAEVPPGTLLADLVSAVLDHGPADEAMMKRNMECISYGRLFCLQKATVVLNATSGKCVTTSKNVVCPPGVTILVDQGDFLIKKTGCLGTSCMESHGECHGAITLSAEENDQIVVLHALGTLQLEKPLVLGTVTCFGCPTPRSGPALHVSLRANTTESSAVSISGMMLIGNCPLTLQRLTLSTAHCDSFSCAASTTFIAAPKSLGNPHLASSSGCAAENFLSEKYFDLHLDWVDNGCGELQIARDNLMMHESGVLGAIRNVLQLLAEEYLQESRRRLVFLREELVNIRTDRRCMAEKVSASKNVTCVTHSDCVAISLVSRIFLHQYSLIASQMPPLPPPAAGDMLFGKLQFGCRSTSLFHHLRGLDVVLKNCRNAWSQSAAHCIDQSVASEMYLLAEQSKLSLAERERDLVISDLQQRINALEKCLVGFISLYTIDSLHFQGRFSLPGKTGVSIALCLNGTIRGHPFSSHWPLNRASVSQSELCNAVLYHSREMLRLILISDTSDV